MFSQSNYELLLSINNYNQCNQPMIYNTKSIKETFKDINNMKKLLYGCNEFNENFDLINYVNSGSCGVVYEGKLKKSKNGQSVGLKFLIGKTDNKKQKNDKSKLKEFYFQQKLHHKNITSLYGYYELKNYSCIAMDFAKYGDLDHFQKKIIPNKTISETVMAYFALQILEGLQYCHQCKVIHLDIKQQNILIDEKLTIKITDFSISQSYEKCKTGDKIILPLAGTSLYMSPEVLGNKEIDVEDCNKIDIFSLGVVLYNIAFKIYPYNLDISYRKNFRGILNKINDNELTFPNKNYYSNLFMNFVKGLLNKNLKERLSISEALEHPWIKAARLIFKEKEKVYDLEKFLINMFTSNIKPFNDSIKNYRAENSTSDIFF